MQPEHTWILFDSRPMKAAAHRVIDEAEAWHLNAKQAADELHRLAASLPDLDPDEYRSHMERLLRAGLHDRARRLVDCLPDQTLKAWVRPAVRLTWLAVKALALAAFVWFVVWLSR